jgi:hypothetical protein
VVGTQDSSPNEEIRLSVVGTEANTFEKDIERVDFDPGHSTYSQKERWTVTPKTAAQEAAYAQVNGPKLHYEIHGSGQPLILLHGGVAGIVTSGCFAGVVLSLRTDFEQKRRKAVSKSRVLGS